MKLKSAVRSSARLLALVATASAILLGGANPSSAAVYAGDGTADENVYCNSVTHQIGITTWSNGILSNQIGGSELFPYYLPYPVYLRIQKVVNGTTAFITNWLRVSDGTHSYVINSPAGQTSFFYFRWAFMTPSGQWAWRNEWAGGNAPYGWYSDQRGYRSLTSCRT